MKLVAWNYRGLGNQLVVRGLLDHQKSKGVDILFLSETKLKESRMQMFSMDVGSGEHGGEGGRR